MTLEARNMAQGRHKFPPVFIGLFQVFRVFRTYPNVPTPCHFHLSM